MTKKTGDKSGTWRAKSATGSKRSAGSADLFAWASNHDQSAKATKPGSKSVVNIDDARAHRAKMSAGQANRRAYRSRGIGAIVPKLTRQAIGTKASMDADLQIYWREVVGDDFAASTFPRRTRFDQPARRINGVLELTVERGYGTFMTHAKGQILDKLNSYFGIGTFRDIKFKEGPLPDRTRNAAQPKRRQAPLMHIDLNDPGTRSQLGLRAGAGGASGARSPTTKPNWVPPTPKRHRLALTMDDQGGTGVGHKPLADALTYLGASLANRDQ